MVTLSLRVLFISLLMLLLFLSLFVDGFAAVASAEFHNDTTNTTTTNTYDNNNNNSTKQKRVVIFVGPHKSASSTVQEFLVQYATGRKKHRKLKAFQNWRWPAVQTNNNKKIPQRKILSRLVYNNTNVQNGSGNNNNEDDDEMKLLRQNILNSIVQTCVDFPNLVLGSEEFDRFGTTPWSHRNGIEAVKDITEHLVNCSRNITIVVNYRTPRHHQWISIWKQLTLLGSRMFHEPNYSYEEWICSKRQHIKIWEYLDCVANPLGLAEQFIQENNKHNNNWQVTLIDMGGVSSRNYGIEHISACDVLHVPCRNGQVNGIEQVLWVNPKTKTLNISSRQQDEMEWLFRERDCLYRPSLEGNPNLNILYQHSLWKDCYVAAPTAAEVEEKDDDDNEQSLLSLLSNTSFVLELLKSQFSCQSDKSINLTSWKIKYQRRQQQQQQLQMTPEEGTIMKKKKEYRSSPEVLSSDYSSDWMMMQSFQWLALVFLFLSLFQVQQKRRRRRFHHHHHQQQQQHRVTITR